jgi:AcrR family transcriptional regulator
LVATKTQAYRRSEEGNAMTSPAGEERSTGREIRRELAERIRAERAAHAARMRAERDEFAQRMATERDRHIEQARAAAGAARATRLAQRRGRAEEPTGTRERIQEVALELFTERGYDATSLREIAERLGVTKAALYYHFRTKDEIVESLVADRVARIDELVAWAEGQPRTTATRLEFVRKYAALLHEGRHHGLMRFFERNQGAMAAHKSGEQMRERMSRMLDVLCDRDAPLADQVRRSLALFALHATWFVIRDPAVTDDERRTAALTVALDLVERGTPT